MCESRRGSRAGTRWLAGHPRQFVFSQRGVGGGFGGDLWVCAELLHDPGRRGGLRALLPLMEVDSWLTGRRGVSLPFTDDSEPFYADENAFKEVYETVLDFGRARKWKYVEFRGGRKFFGDVPASLSFYGHELDLTADEEQLFGRVDNSVRRGDPQGRKSGRDGGSGRHAGSRRDFLQAAVRDAEKARDAAAAVRVFQNIHRHILSKKLGNVILARFEGQANRGGGLFSGWAAERSTSMARRTRRSSSCAATTW